MMFTAGLIHQIENNDLTNIEEKKMYHKKIFNIVFVLSLILVSGFAATPTTATAPIQTESPYYWSGRLDNECGFKIYTTSTGILRSTFWYDENGNLSMGHNFFKLTEIWSAHGKSLEFNYNYPINGWVETYPNGYVAFLGAEIITLPGDGAVLKSAGVYSYKFTLGADGEIILLDPLKVVGVEYADWDAICEYLAR